MLCLIPKSKQVTLRLFEMTSLFDQIPFFQLYLTFVDIREGIKEFSNWPTIPQLYVNGEFVGGADIMREMYQSGELKKLLEGYQ